MSDFAYISVGRYLYVTNYKPPRNCDWEVRKDGYYLNGRAFVGRTGDSYNYVPDDGINQIAIVGDRFEGMGTANVYVNGKLEKTISADDIDSQDRKAFKFTSRSYMRILYASPLFNEPPNIEIEVTSGEFHLTGFIVGSLDDSTNVNNGPMPTETPTAYPQETGTPAPTQEPPRQPTPEVTEEQPEPENPTEATPVQTPVPGEPTLQP